MRVMDVVNEAKGAMRASEVFGTPYEKNGVTIIPAAKIAGGAGGGGDQAQPQAGGVGFGVSSRPVGAFVIISFVLASLLEGELARAWAGEIWRMLKRDAAETKSR